MRLNIRTNEKHPGGSEPATTSTIYITREMRAEAQRMGLNVSGICRAALAREIKRKQGAGR